MVKSSSETPSVFERDGDTEQRILDAAHRVFLRRGTTGARMQEIADEAGVNKALLHYYFRSKERLSEAVFQQVARRLLPPLLELIDSDVPIEEKVQRVVHWELDHLSQSPLLPGYVISELHQNPERAHQFITAMTGVQWSLIAPSMIERLRTQIAEGVEAGTMRPIAPEHFIVNLISLCIFPFALKPMLMTVLGMRNEDFDRFIEQRRTEVVAFFLQALRA